MLHVSALVTWRVQFDDESMRIMVWGGSQAILVESAFCKPKGYIMFVGHTSAARDSIFGATEGLLRY